MISKIAELDLILDRFLIYDNARGVYFVPPNVYHQEFVPALEKLIKQGESDDTV